MVEVIEEEDVCETCGGTGVVSTMEQVYPGEPHYAPIGECACPDCSASYSEDDYDEEN